MKCNKETPYSSSSVAWVQFGGRNLVHAMAQFLLGVFDPRSQEGNAREKLQIDVSTILGPAKFNK